MLFSQQELVKKTIGYYGLALNGLINQPVQSFHGCKKRAIANGAELVL